MTDPRKMAAPDEGREAEQRTEFLKFLDEVEDALKSPPGQGYSRRVSYITIEDACDAGGSEVATPWELEQADIDMIRAAFTPSATPTSAGSERAVAEKIDSVLSEAANACRSDEQYYLHGLWKARAIVAQVAATLPAAAQPASPGHEPLTYCLIAPGCHTGPCESRANVALSKALAMPPGTAIVPLYAAAQPSVPAAGNAQGAGKIEITGMLEPLLLKSATREQLEEAVQNLRAQKFKLQDELAALRAGAAKVPEVLSSLKLRCGYIINGYVDAKMEAVEMERLINEWFAAAPSSEQSKEG
ncbi:MAG: hypothetical protein OEW90_01900 [Betaproteobacteria bacterium]|nr:hypothetical protein [Betaproteobacteria bacterium]MDH4322873.1 hypothetical protein [Betaproteobacteria bacterium]